MKRSVQGPMVWVMAVTAGIVVANNYYCQPLLAEFAQVFSASDAWASWVALATQLGYAIGMLVLLPLGDMVERRSLILVMLGLSALALIAFAHAPTIGLLIAAGFGIGFTSMVPQILPPFVSQLAPKGEGGGAVGLVMAGLLLGILLSRFVSGTIADLLGWQAVYHIAAGVMLVLIVVLALMLPRSPPKFSGSYGELFVSLGRLWRLHPVLRITSIAAALQFGAFSVFWTTLAFHLAALPQHYGSDVAGALALVGACGVLAAPAAGRLSDRMKPTVILMASGALMAASFLTFMALGGTIWGLIPGIILLDLGMQVSHVSSMNRNYHLDATAISRLNTVYMVTRFLGAAVGTGIGAYAWNVGEWTGVSIAGFALCAIALLVQSRLAKAEAAIPAPSNSPA